MLQSIRENAQGMIVKFLIGFLAVGFVFFGVDFLHIGKTPPKAKVNSDEISQAEFRAAMDRQRRMIQSRLGSVDPSLLQEDKLAETVVNGLIQERLLQQQAKTQHLSASRGMIDRLILGEQAFQENGKFSEQRYRELIARMGMSSQSYRATLASDLEQQHMSAGLAGTEFETPEHFAVLLDLLRQRRDIRYITLQQSDFAGKVPVSDQQVHAWYDAHPDLFMSDESVDIDYLLVSKSDFYPDIPEKELHDRYDQEMANYQGHVERHAAHILLEVNDGTTEAQARSKAQALRQRIEEGESFESLAKQYSQDPGSARAGGDVGYSAGDVFPAEFESTLASLQPGEVSGPIVTEAGVHLIKLLDVRDKKPPTFEESRDRIALSMKQAAAESVFASKIEELADQTFTAADLATASDSLGIPIRSVAGLTRKSNDPVLGNTKVLSVAFSPDLIQSGANSQVIELDDSRVLVLRVKGHKMPALLPFAEVQASATEKARAALETEAMMAEAESLRAKLRAGADIESVALASGHPWQVALGVDRFSTALPPALQSFAFSQAAPPAGSRLVDVYHPSEREAYVMEISGVKGRAEGPAVAKADDEAMRQFLVNDQGQFLAFLWESGLRRAADVHIN